MLFRKCERKKHSICIILTIGALAAVGAMTISKKGKQMCRQTMNKMKNMLGMKSLDMTEDISC